MAKKRTSRRSKRSQTRRPAPEVKPAPAPPPPAQTTQGADVATKPLPRCIKCRSTQFTVIKKIGEQRYSGTDSHGQRYTSIVRQRVRCNVCDQVQVQISRPFNAKLWASGK